MLKLRLSISIIAIFSLIAGYGIQRYLRGPQIDERSYLKDLAPEARFLEKQGNPPVYRAHDNTIAFNTFDVLPQVRGYAGPIKVMVALDRDARILGLRIVEHHETKNYVHYMELPAYLSQFIGKYAGDAFELDKDIDSITRATVSVKALADTVKGSSRIVAANALGKTFPALSGTTQKEYAWMGYSVLFVFALSCSLFLKRLPHHQRLRDASLAAGILVIGIYLSSPFSILHVFNLVLLRPSSSILWLVIVASTLISVLIAGRFYCGWLCPFGAIAEFIGRIPARKWEIPSSTDNRWRNLKYVILALAVMLVFASHKVEYGNYEAYVTLFSFHGNALAWSLVAFSLLANLRIKRFWCRYLCPVAALTGLLSREAKGYPSRSDCPMQNKPHPLISECIRCNRCSS